MYDLFIETKERGDGTASGIKKKKELERLKIFKQKNQILKKNRKVWLLGQRVEKGRKKDPKRERAYSKKPEV